MEITAVVLSALTLGLVQMIKSFGLPQKFTPLIALAVGIGLSLLAMLINGLGVVISIFQGLMIGLASVGLYSGVKNSIDKR